MNLHALIQPLRLSLEKEREAAAFIILELGLTEAKAPSPSDPDYLKKVEALFLKSDLYARAKDAAAVQKSRLGTIDPLSEEGERARRALTHQHAFYGPRYVQLTSIATYFKTIQAAAEVRAARDTFINEIAQHMQSKHNMQPHPIGLAIMILRSITDEGEIKPQILFLLIRWILSITPNEEVYSTMNWMNILPLDQFNSLLKGEPIPIEPHHRTTEIGAGVLKITSFPLMPEVSPWNLAPWNTHQINYVLGSAAASAAANGGTKEVAVSPPDCFRKEQKRIVGLDELNACLADIANTAGGARINLSVDNGVVNLLPLVAHLRALHKDTPNRRRGNRKADDKPASV